MTLEATQKALTPVSTRLAKLEDLEVCIAFDCTDPTDSRGDEEKKALIKSRIDTGEIFLATTSDGKPIGYLAIDRLWPMMLPLLSWVYVAPAWRDQGVARTLVEFCFQNLKQRNYKRILISTQTDREKMIQTIQKMGLREIGSLNANPDEAVAEVFYMKEL